MLRPIGLVSQMPRWGTLIFALGLAGCGGGTSSGIPTPAPSVSVSVSPTSSNVQAAATQQFSATVTGVANTAVGWQVNGTLGGSTAIGTISSTGLYTAPGSVPNPSTITVTAVSAADPTKSASAQVTIAPPPMAVTVTPTTAQVITLHSQQFTANVSNTSNASVMWTVNGNPGGSVTVGQISSNGLYTAPAAVPTPAVLTVTCTSVTDPSKSASAQVTVLAPPAPTGTWSYVGPHGAMGPSQILFDPRNAQTVYVSTYWGGLYKSTNAGANWNVLIYPTGFASWLAVAPTSGTLYLFGRQQFRASSDGGKTFGAAVTYPGGLNGATTDFTFAVDPANDLTLYVMTATSLMRTKDGGATWSPLTIPPKALLFDSTSGNQLSLGHLLVSSANSTVLMATTADGLAVSRDGGITWQVQKAGMDPSFTFLTQVVQDRNAPNRLLAIGGYSAPTGTTPQADVYVSTDGGATWAYVMPIDVFSRMPQDQTGPGIYTFSLQILFATFDNGATLKRIAPAADATGFSADMSPLSPNLMVYQGADDFYVSQDSGSTWSLSETNIDSRQLGSIKYAGTTGPLYVAAYPTDADTSRVWQSSNGTQSWALLQDGRSTIPFWDFDVDPANPLHLVAPEANTYPYSVMSSDGGQTWTQTPYAAGMAGGFGPYLYSSVRFGASGSNFVFGCGTFGVARLATTTNSWSIINNGLAAGSNCSALGIDRATPGTVFAATSTGVYKSTDSGNNWSAFEPGTKYQTILIDPANHNNIFLSANYANSMRTTDGGKTWLPMLVEGVIAFNPTNSSIIWGAATNGFVSVSYDSGLTWGHLTAPVGLMEDLAVLPSGAVVITTDTSSVIQFTPQ